MQAYYVWYGVVPLNFTVVISNKRIKLYQWNGKSSLSPMTVQLNKNFERVLNGDLMSLFLITCEKVIGRTKRNKKRIFGVSYIV